QRPTSDDPTIAWAPVPEASVYQVRVSTDVTFPAGPDTQFCWTAATTFTPYALGDPDLKEKIIHPDDCIVTSKFSTIDPNYYQVVAFDDSTANVINADNAPNANFNCKDVQPECDALTLGPIGSCTWNPPAPVPGASGDVTGLATT